MSGADPILDFQSAPVNAGGMPTAKAAQEKTPKNILTTDVEEGVTISAAQDLHDGEEIPTEEELSTLRKVSAPMPWPAIAMCLIEFSERASYYGCKGPFNNFVNNPLPPGSTTGAVAHGAAGLNQHAGALGLGSVDASALTNLFTFLAYVIPIFGGIVADTKWGRFKTICVGTFVGAIAHVLLVIPALPPVIKHPNGALGAFIIAIVTLAFAAGFIKPSLGPMLCDQSPVKHAVITTTKRGERVILDPQFTIQRYLMIFYWCINVGAIFAIATSYAERDVGFWLAYLLPGILYMLMPIVLFAAYKRLYIAPPQGSVLVEAWQVFKVLMAHGGWRRSFKGGDAFWDTAKPSYIFARDGHVDIDKVFWDDRFVDEIKQSFQACQVFALIPIFALADGGFGNELNDMSSAMVTGSLPNDLINNWNSLAIIVGTPILTWGFYPMMAKLGHPLKPMTRMSIGFMLGCITCVLCAIIQWRVYATSACGKYASTCDTVSSVSLWWQVPIYTLPAIGELFVNVTSYELAYTRAPARMKGLVWALALFNSAIASALGLACSNAITDPYLEWTWTALAIASFLCAVAFPTYFRHLNIGSENFMDKDRQAGRQQPRALLEEKANHGQVADPDAKY